MRFIFPSIEVVRSDLNNSFLEFMKIVRITAIGAAAFGAVGFLVKLVFIPINQIIIGS